MCISLYFICTIWYNFVMICFPYLCVYVCARACVWERDSVSGTNPRKTGQAYLRYRFISNNKRNITFCSYCGYKPKYVQLMGSSLQTGIGLNVQNLLKVYMQIDYFWHFYVKVYVTSHTLNENIVWKYDTSSGRFTFHESRFHCCISMISGKCLLFEVLFIVISIIL
jgi:hypothetical protein